MILIISLVKELLRLQNLLNESKYVTPVKVPGIFRTNKDTPENLPDVIFLDINMPIVDGFVFLFEFEMFPDQIKEKCKVIILSSSNNKRDIAKIVDNEYVIKFITKPLTEKALQEIQALLVERV